MHAGQIERLFTKPIDLDELLPELTGTTP